MTETDLFLGRVHVDIDPSRIQRQEEKDGRVTVGRKQRAVSLANGMVQNRRARAAAIDEQVLFATVRPAERRQADEAGHAAGGTRLADGPELVDVIRAEQVAQAIRRIGPADEFVDAAAVDAQDHADLRVRKRQNDEDGSHMRQLGFLRAQKLASGRHVKKEIANLDRRAGGNPHLPDVEELAPRHGQFRADRRADPAGGQAKPRYRGNGGERFAPEPERGDRFDVIHRVNLAGRVPFDGEQGVVAIHARSVIGHADQPAPPGHDLDGDLGGAGVDGILDQFLDHRGRAFHHFAGGDLVGDDLG